MKGIGLMSGTSLDGLDIALVDFTHENQKYSFTVLEAETLAYTANWRAALQSAPSLSGHQLLQLHRDYGKWLGEQVQQFLSNYNQTADFIGSHGHTLFHEPLNEFNFQLGEGSALAVSAGIPVYCDFRSLDILLGGQGAPLVPIGDKYLFSEYRFCLNLGGFANLSVHKDTGMLAYDISACNLVLNHFAQRMGAEYDEGGRLARSGKFRSELFQALEAIEYYSKTPPKSLGREWFEAELLPVLDAYSVSPEDVLHTFTEHLARQITQSIKPYCRPKDKLLVTGGGAHNDYLISRLVELAPIEIIKPSRLIIDFKEAIVFAFLAYLRQIGQANVLRSVTGARFDHFGGTYHLPR